MTGRTETCIIPQLSRAEREQFLQIVAARRRNVTSDQHRLEELLDALVRVKADRIPRRLRVRQGELEIREIIVGATRSTIVP